MEKDMMTVAQNEDVDITALFTSFPESKKLHSKSVGALTKFLVERSLEDVALGFEYSAPPEVIRSAAILHDLGMSLIPECILSKVEALSDAEHRIIQRHTIYGAKLLERHRKKCSHEADNAKLLVLAAEIALSHHEHWDGKGYPYGQMTTAILPEARAVSVAEAYDTIVRGESYCMALPHEYAILEIAEQSGHQFDPYFSALFLKYEAKLRELWTQINSLKF